MGGGQREWGVKVRESGRGDGGGGGVGVGGRGFVRFLEWQRLLLGAKSRRWAKSRKQHSSYRFFPRQVPGAMRQCSGTASCGIMWVIMRLYCGDRRPLRLCKPV